VRPAFRLLRAVAAVGGAAALVVPAYLGTSIAADQTVLVGDNNENKFTPASVTIKPGDTVTWQYAGGTDHTVTSTTANWDKNDRIGVQTPPNVTGGITTSYKFDVAGTYRYICTTHKNAGMKGTVVVSGTKPKPTATRTSSPPPTSPTSRPPTSSAPTGSSSASPSAGSATPVVPTGSVPTESETPPPLPTVAPTTGGPQFLGVGGLTTQPATGREKGLPVMLALLLLGGVGSAELRALLANAPTHPRRF